MPITRQKIVKLTNMNSQKCEVGNIEYLFDKEKGFDILIDNQTLKSPETICKYFSISKNNICAFLEHYLYASHPKDFNDPFDCNEKLITPPKSTKELCIYNEISNQIKVNKNHHLISIFHHWLFYHYGIVSMTMNASSMYMWTHYTNNHSGFLLKFKTDKLLKSFTGIYKVNYVKSINSVEFDINHLAAQTLMMICTKSISWIDEDEWRLLVYGGKMFVPGIHNENEHNDLINNRKIKYDSDSIEEIILGHRFFDRKNIDKIVDKKYYLAFDKKEDNLKVKLLDFLINKGIKTKWIFLNLFDFELEPMNIKISKNGRLFIFDIIDDRFKI